MSTTVGTAALAGVLSLGLAGVHLAGGALRLLDGLPRSRWLSFSGGVSVAYVFVHVLPELARATRHVGREPLGLGFLERHVYLLALAGFVAYYGVERAAKRAADRDAGGEVFRMHLGAFALYDVLVGYLLVHREVPGLGSRLLFAVAMGTHFVVTDWGLRYHHGDRYHDRGRWLLAAAVVAGTALGFVVALDHAALALPFSFLAGGVVLNVVKEEVPPERESHFPAFAAGAVGYAAVLLFV